jgi:hypothetical protein
MREPEEQMGDFEERGYGQCMGSDSFLTLFLQGGSLWLREKKNPKHHRPP